MYLPRGGITIRGVCGQFVRFHPTSTWAKIQIFVPEHFSSTFCEKVQHIAIHCNTLYKHTASHCNTLQHIATHCNTLHQTTRITTSLQLGLVQRLARERFQRVAVIHFSHPKSKYFVLEHYSLNFCSASHESGATHLQHTATHCNAPLAVCFT